MAEKTAKSARRSLVSRAGAAARKVVGRPARESALKSEPGKKAAGKKTASVTSAPRKATAAKKPAAPRKATQKETQKTTQKETRTTAVKKSASPASKAVPAVKKAPVKKAAKKAVPAAKKAAPAAKKAAPAAKKAAPAAKKAPVKKAASAAKEAAAPTRRTPASRLVVLEAEDPWTTEELAEVRNQLHADVKRLRAELQEGEDDLSTLMRDAGEGAGNDQADVGSATFERDQEMTIVNNAREMLSQSERALERIADRSYGACESCGQPIGKNRLMVFPRATLCLTCKQREERR